MTIVTLFLSLSPKVISLSISPLVETYNYINKSACKTLPQTTIGWCHTTWVEEHTESPIGKMNTPPSKEFRLAPINKISTSMLPSTFVNMLYHKIQKYCTYPNYDVIPNISENRK